MRLSRPVFYTCLISTLAVGPSHLPAAAAAAAQVQAESPARKSFRIRADDASSALQVFAEQASVAIIFLVEHVRGSARTL